MIELSTTEFLQPNSIDVLWMQLDARETLVADTLNRFPLSYWSKDQHDVRGVRLLVILSCQELWSLVVSVCVGPVRTARDLSWIPTP